MNYGIHRGPQLKVIENIEWAWKGCIESWHYNPYRFFHQIFFLKYVFFILKALLELN